jgi:peptidoglycan hydrolase-like protein with peptidoglycan-binding domain
MTGFKTTSMHFRFHLAPRAIVLFSFFTILLPPCGGMCSRSRVWADPACAQPQEFVITAYYSPLPNQERYSLGSYAADVALNGQGIRGEDGTPVYPGMIAAPEEYPFGTVIELPEYGIVGTVHDRGSEIVLGEDGPRLDLWVGSGEEGLARALEWGVRKISGKVYQPAHDEMPEESFNLQSLPAPESALVHLPRNPILLVGIADPLYGETSDAVAAVQQALQDLGYFDHDVTSYFGDVTREALLGFQRDTELPLQGERADEATRALLLAHREIVDELPILPMSEEILLSGKSGKEVRILQRTLKFLGRYDGELDGIYDEELMGIVFAFQRERGIVQGLLDSGAGMVGPQTRRALLTSFREERLRGRGGGTVLAARTEESL